MMTSMMEVTSSTWATMEAVVLTQLCNEQVRVQWALHLGSDP